MTEVDVNEELRNIENTLRDIISFALNDCRGKKTKGWYIS